jgi:hypothetical protein
MGNRQTGRPVQEGDIGCTIAASRNERFLITLEHFREAAYWGPADEKGGIAAGLYWECIAAREAFVNHVQVHKCGTPPKKRSTNLVKTNPLRSE